MAAISNMVSSWLRKRSKKDQNKQVTSLRRPPTSKATEHYTGRGRLPQSPLPSRTRASPSLIYEEIPALVRDSPAIVDVDINVNNLDFANAKEMGPYLMVPYKKHEPGGRAVFDARTFTNTMRDSATDQSRPNKCACPPSRINNARHNHDKMYSSSETLGSQYNSFDVYRSTDRQHAGPDVLKHVTSSEIDTDSGSGCSCYRTQDILLRPPVIVERRRSVTSTETDNYYETVGCQVISEESTKKSSHVIYSSVNTTVKRPPFVCFW